MNKHKHKIFTFAALMTTATVVVHFINRTIAATAQLKQLLGLADSRTFEWRFGNIYYTKKGKGSPILLIHDMLPGGSGYEWSKIEDDLALEHTVYNLDLPGCGRSEKSGITYTNFVYVQAICDFIKNVIGEKTDVIVNGYAVSFVVMACHNEKDLFNKIMMVNPVSLSSLKQMPGKKEKLLRRCLEIPVFGTLVYHMVVSRDAVNNEFIENYAFDPFHPDRELQDAYYEAAHKGGYYAKCLYSSQSAKYMNINIRHAVESIDNSIYIVEGEDEPNGAAIVEAYQKVNPAIESATIPCSKHFPHIENVEAFLEQVGAFF